MATTAKTCAEGNDKSSKRSVPVKYYSGLFIFTLDQINYMINLDQIAGVQFSDRCPSPIPAGVCYSGVIDISHIGHSVKTQITGRIEDLRDIYQKLQSALIDHRHGSPTKGNYTSVDWE